MDLQARLVMMLAVYPSALRKGKIIGRDQPPPPKPYHFIITSETQHKPIQKCYRVLQSVTECYRVLQVVLHSTGWFKMGVLFSSEPGHMSALSKRHLRWVKHSGAKLWVWDWVWYADKTHFFK